MSVILLPLMLIFELIQQADAVNFKLFFEHFEHPSENSHFEHFERETVSYLVDSCLLP